MGGGNGYLGGAAKAGAQTSKDIRGLLGDKRVKNESLDQFGRTNFETILPEPILLQGYRRILQTIYEPKRYLDRVLSMLQHKRELPSRPGWLRPRHIVGAARALAAQGLLSHYRAAYWRFLGEVVRSHRSRFAEALVAAAAGHHFIEYTRRVVVPRLTEHERTPVPARGAVAETGSAGA